MCTCTQQLCTHTQNKSGTCTQFDDSNRENFNMKQTVPCLDTSKSQFIKASCIITLGVLMISNGHAVPTEIAALKSIGDKVIPYLTWMIALGGGAIASVNAWRLFNGQPKASVGALGGMLVSGIGFNGIFGADAATLLI